ncbi:MAG: diaminobutyrate acetyltransferase [Aliarcobacter sp.]|nr:diaminobutyrate acetyltransferase [Aliarcobacter sp.]
MSRKIKFSKPKKSQTKEIIKLVKDTKILDVNSEYLYYLQTIHFNEFCCVALDETKKDKVIGFVSGYLIPNENSLFIWQVAVDEKYRGLGLAQRMILKIVNRKSIKKINFIKTTVSPSNQSSIRVFEKVASELNTKIKKHKFLKMKDFTNSHEDEPMYVIGSINKKDK